MGRRVSNADPTPWQRLLEHLAQTRPVYMKGITESRPRPRHRAEVAP